ncbi:MAG: cyclic nucleotide-binding domain-containing protein [Bdellovibrionales bacterium]|nr:cyclic nucleotide-binding domain-containing protein [Bdellovibrionales bacterium]
MSETTRAFQVLIFCSQESSSKLFSSIIEKASQESKIFICNRATDYEFRLSTLTPELIIYDLDAEGEKSLNAYIEELVKRSENTRPQIVIVNETGDPKHADHEEWVARGLMTMMRRSDTSENKVRTLVPILERLSRFKAHKISELHLKSGETLIREGEMSHTVYFLKSGKLRAVLKYKKEDEEILGDIEPGEFVGEIAAFQQVERTATVIALEQSLVIEFDGDRFKDFVLTKPTWGNRLFTSLTKRLQIMNKKKNAS